MEKINMAFVIVIMIVIAVFGVLIPLFMLIKKRKMTFPFLYKASNGQFFSIAKYNTSDPLSVDMHNVKKVVVGNNSSVPCPLQMMADPFVLKYNNEYYIFYEELTQKKYAKGADIAVLHSKNGEHWNRLGVVLKEPFHLSFPNVFRYNGEYYMLPEAAACGEMRIYRAIDFPMKWEKYSVVFAGRSYSDPMVYVKNEYIYILYHTYLDGDELRMIYSRDIKGPWIEHPKSPIRIMGNDTRPAGTINCIKDELYYFVQDHSEGYGTGVVAYHIKVLTPTMFVDERMQNNPLLWKNGDAWAKDGMHHYSMTMIRNDEWLCVMDGCRNTTQNDWRWEWRNLPIWYGR